MNEQKLKELMALSRLQLPFSDFEERMMLRVQQEQQVKRAAERYRKISWLFFVLGAVLGGMATVLINALPGFSNEALLLGCRLAYVAFLLIALNYLLSGTRLRLLKSSL